MPPLNFAVRRLVKFTSSYWGESVEIDEVEAQLTSDGIGRVSIVRRNDGFFCIYSHWVWSSASPEGHINWFKDTVPPELLYQDREPRVGVYGTLEDARREVRALIDARNAGS